MGELFRVITDTEAERHSQRSLYTRVAPSNNNRITGYLFLSNRSSEENLGNHALLIPAIRLVKGSQKYTLSSPLNLDLRSIQPDLYQVHLVQDFWSDDDNPNTDECLAAIFLGRRRMTGEWEMPERWPIECRSLKIIGMIDMRSDRQLFSAYYND